MELKHLTEGIIHDPSAGDLARAVRSYGPLLKKHLPTFPTSYESPEFDLEYVVLQDQRASMSVSLNGYRADPGFALYFSSQPDATKHRAYSVAINECIQALTCFLKGDPSWRTSYDWHPKIRPPAAKAAKTVSPVVSAQTGRDTKTGVVYLLQSGLWFKIGKTIDPKARYARLDIQLPQKAERVHAITTNNVDRLEHHWHTYFRDKRANGEWFQLSEEDVREFRSCQRVEYEAE